MNIYDFNIDELGKYFESIGDKKFRAIQIFEWLYLKRIDDFQEMTNLKKETIEHVKNNFNLRTIKLIEHQKDIDVQKFLFELKDGEHIEAVLMKHIYGNSLCVSTQVGCNMGCRFCESGRLKKKRNLETGEMIEQILEIEKTTGSKITHVVLMGIGEPFDNYDNIVNFINIINYPKGLAIGSRHITVSTCGLIPKIIEFSELPYQVNLAISLHAPNNEIRDKIMPINKVYRIEELISTLKDYIRKTNRKVTFEYILIAGINDSEENAKELAKLIKGMNAYVNIIPYNETNNINLYRSSKENIRNFYDTLKKSKINATIRREYGSKISAACGQLRSQKEDNQ